MRKISRLIYYASLLLFSIKTSGQESDSTVIQLMSYYQTVNNFFKYIPQEKVYLHFDNTSYYQGDNIWFNCYVVTSEFNHVSELSKTLYVELLNPGGEIIDKKTLKIENGQCHGDFTLNRIPFYSGFYEVRAYTKYMLNFGEEALFSRLLPIFDKPKQEGKYEEKKIMNYGVGSYPVLRKKPLKEKKVNVKFFPEGGYLVEGIPSQVAFEATDAYGNPIDVTGSIINKEKEELVQYSSIHDGRGVFTYTPSADNKTKAVIDYKGKKYQFDMPDVQPKGFVIKIDNLTSTDSIEVCIQKNVETPSELLGMAVINNGRVRHFCLTNIDENKILSFKINKKKLTSGISRVVLFNSNGRIIGDRLLFTSLKGQLNIQAKMPKEKYEPYELINLEFTVKSKDYPVQSPFSLSIRDGANEVEYNHSILTDLLLMSEIKGYVKDPSYYFESNDLIHRTALDLLLMVQGWRRYSWEQMAEIKPIELKYKPEQGIEIEGKVISYVRGIPKPNIEVSSFLQQKGENEDAKQFIMLLNTDSLGCFSFNTDMEGDWEFILGATKKGKKTDHRIILNRAFSPDPKRYQYTDLQINIAGAGKETVTDNEPSMSQEEDIESFFKSYTDSLSRKGSKEKIHRLKEVTITAKKNTKEKDIYNSRSKSLACYDIRSEVDNIKDSGKFIGNNIHEFIMQMNNKFTTTPDGEFLKYKRKLPLFVINYERTKHDRINYFYYKTLRLENIKSMYISEDLTTLRQYTDPMLTTEEIMSMFSCVVLIETYPEGEIPVAAGRGVRKTKLKGYSQVKEFYSPDYSTLPHDPDYRRTLYWNPSVLPDSEGKAIIQFYNNSTCRKFTISAETVTPEGTIGVYQK